MIAFELFNYTEKNGEFQPIGENDFSLNEVTANGA